MPEATTTERHARKVRQGVVVSLSGDKSIVVLVSQRKRHPKYGKMMTRSKKLHVHDEQNTAGLGDTVKVMECRPLSATKRWRLVDIIERAK
ncbi:30S ribosomal protein S17 [Collinsella sp. AGMB00827]|uniref:Small ribosomal subunit protein uS17 n=1 Tax=Collinsella ureilytica TaxID=2869515 RepID=A0ABS7MM29_9ACTN|nr:30S ribosomal protein S17 [Collinsella urealyticum]MBY4798160.1 30S ribosomal protein S17 [Collinsella urealyticum]